MEDLELLKSIFDYASKQENATVSITIAVVLGLVLLKRIWRNFSSEFVTTLEDSAKVSVLTSMQNDIERLHQEIDKNRNYFKTELKTLKEQHEKEKDELYARIRQLEAIIVDLNSKYEDIRSSAMDIYTYINDNINDFHDTHANELKERLVKIATAQVTPIDSNSREVILKDSLDFRDKFRRRNTRSSSDEKI